MRFVFVYFIFLLFISFGSVSAVTLSDTTLSTSVSNTTLIVQNYDLTTDVAEVNNDSIRLYNISYTVNGLTVNSTQTINFTGNNTTYYSDQILYVKSSTATTRVLTSTVTQNFAANIIVYNVGGVRNATLYHSSTGTSENVTGTYDIAAGTFTFNATLTPGDNTLVLTPPITVGVAACATAGTGLTAFANYLQLVAIAIVAGIVLYAVYKWQTGDYTFDTSTVIKAGVALVVAGIFISIGVIIISGAANTCI